MQLHDWTRRSAWLGLASFVALVACPTGAHAQISSAYSGAAVCARDGYVAIGAPLLSNPATEEGTGGVYILREDGGWQQDAVLFAADGDESNYFGSAVGIDAASGANPTLVVGAPTRFEQGKAIVGAAYVFERSGGSWSQAAKLLAPGGAAFDKFGSSVAVSAGTIVVGSPFDDDACSALDADHASCNSGAVFVYEKVGGVWTQTAKLVAQDAGRGDLFGFSVAIDQDVLVIGAKDQSSVVKDGGAAYIFERSGGTWSQTAKLVAHDPAAEAEFGMSVAVDGTRVVVGAPHGPGPTGVPAVGAVYVFEKSGGVWSTVGTKVYPPNEEAKQAFGRSVGLSGNTLLVGAPFGNGGYNAGNWSLMGTGRAYLVVRSGGAWWHLKTLTPADGAANDRFGRAVAIDGPSGFVGAFFHNGSGLASGAVYGLESGGGFWSFGNTILPW